eukprot:2778667-Pleurochrysis_carterae.AAC.1
MGLLSGVRRDTIQYAWKALGKGSKFLTLPWGMPNDITVSFLFFQPIGRVGGGLPSAICWRICSADQVDVSPKDSAMKVHGTNPIWSLDTNWVANALLRCARMRVRTL